MATYINAKLRKAIEANDTRTINRECYGLFKADHPDYTIGVSDHAIFKEWVKDFIANVNKPVAKPTADKPTEKAKPTTKKSGSRDKKSGESKAKTNSKSKSNSKSRKEKTKPEPETTPEIDRNKLIAKLKADYICDRISADKFAKTLEILTNM